MTLASTISWLKQYSKRYESHERILQRFEEKQHRDKTIARIDHEAEPINIVCFDGGGMKGCAIMSVFQMIQNKCQDRGTLQHQFHLVAGTSVGGVGALLFSQSETSMDELVIEIKDLLDHIREKSFSQLNFFNLVTHGKLVKRQHSIHNIAHERFGPENTLHNPSAVPAFVLCAKLDEITGRIEPFVLRSYDYPVDDEECCLEEKDVVDQFNDNPTAGDTCLTAADKNKKDTRPYNSITLLRGSSSASLADAVAATTAAPPFFGRVKIDTIGSGQTADFADGGIFCNSPVAIAIDEALHLYPNRPLGVVLSIGLHTDEDKFSNRAIAAAKLSHPKLHYQRIVPRGDALDKCDMTEKDANKIADMEEETRQFMRNDVSTNNLLEVTLGKLFALPPTERINKQAQARTRLPEVQVLQPIVSELPRAAEAIGSLATTCDPKTRYDFSGGIRQEDLVGEVVEDAETTTTSSSLSHPNADSNIATSFICCCFRKRNIATGMPRATTTGSALATSTCDPKTRYDLSGDQISVKRGSIHQLRVTI